MLAGALMAWGTSSSKLEEAEVGFQPVWVFWMVEDKHGKGRVVQLMAPNLLRRRLIPAPVVVP